MRQILLMCLLALVLTGCNVIQYYEPKFAIGMTEQEFKNSNRDAVRVYGDEHNVLIYRTYNRMTEVFKFFRFSKDKLVQFGEGSYADDYRLLLRN